jgi:hypothetical protein
MKREKEGLCFHSMISKGFDGGGIIYGCINLCCKELAFCVLLFTLCLGEHQEQLKLKMERVSCPSVFVLVFSITVYRHCYSKSYSFLYPCIVW